MTHPWFFVFPVRKPDPLGIRLRPINRTFNTILAVIMSTRALRKLQREQERVKTGPEDAEAGSESEPVPEVSPKAHKNAFSFLTAVEAQEEGRDGSDVADDYKPVVDLAEQQNKKKKGKGSTTSRPSKRKAKKKKKKSASRSKTPLQDEAPAKEEPDPQLDEIDAALKTLRTGDGAAGKGKAPPGPDRNLRAFFELLAVDSKNLNALNEMRKLFGNTVVSSESSESAAARRRGRGPQALDLGAALAARYNPVSRGQGLSGLATRRNVFIPGKEEWPKATSGGLGMELVEKAWDFTTEYRFLHSRLYRDVQREFDRCVASMDPQNMIVLLQLHPYHISTLVQVSEIAKQQGDHAVAADLLERALFTFGRSTHSSFGTAIADGKARMDYRRFENREFWLAGWRYITSLGQRGTWRTAYEWAKLLLSLDPEGDPLCMHLILDQLAIRGGEFESLIQLATTDSVDWGQKSPNTQISLALAHHKLKHASEAREALSGAIRSFPWIFERLFRELNIERTPKSIWGRQPRNGHEQLLTEAYAIRAKDMWNVPEALSLMVEVAETTERVDPPAATKDDAITLNEARHFILAETPALLAFLPRSFTREQISATDPLPPEDDLTESNEGDQSVEGLEEDRVPEDEAGLQSWIRGMFSRFDIRGVLPTLVRGASAGPTQPAEGDLAQETGLEADLAHELAETLSSRQTEAFEAIHAGKTPMKVNGAPREGSYYLLVVPTVPFTSPLDIRHG